MDYVANRNEQIKEMLQTIGVDSIEELFCAIPKKIFLSPPEVDDGLSEFEGMRLAEKIAAKNSSPSFESYLGAGAYEHHIPPLVPAICGKSEFLTSYTPYQAEASQGFMQTIFEYQSAICALTGMDGANASVYDGASACAEACLMALRFHKDRNVIAISEGINPLYLKVVEEYLESHDVEIQMVSLDRQLKTKAPDYSKPVAAYLVQSPNYFGVMEEFTAHEGTLLIQAANPVSYGIFPSARDMGADIAVGDTQPFGIALQFGGPYAGYMACRQELIRQLPGRIVGETVDTEGKRGFVLTLQAREQHIRREKATSNICTNQALAALASLVAILWYGKQGVKELALTNYRRASYLRDALFRCGCEILSGPKHFNEFVVRFKKSPEMVQKAFRDQGIEPGVLLKFPQNCFLVAVTETKDKQMLDRYVHVAKSL